MSITYDIIKSWSIEESDINSMEELLDWVSKRQAELKVDIRKKDFSYDGFWYYDTTDGFIRNKNNSFFQIAGYQEIEDDRIIGEQPVIIQNEIGYLGILCQKINDVLYFLMQAKIEPGNINTIQISPTIQATKSNFTRMHGGDAPAYLEYFADTRKHTVVVDQIQSEQSSRFFKKRNRNMIVLVSQDEEIEVLDSHKWMTLGQIKQMMMIDNLVNMDTRTVLSCIPFSSNKVLPEEIAKIENLFKDNALYKSMFKWDGKNETIVQQIFSQINDYKMYKKESSRIVPIKSLKSWEMNEKEIVCKTAHDFKVVYCYIEIEGREVKYWEQPLVEAMGISVLGLFTTVSEGVRKFLVKIRPEIGCFDGAELGPTIQMEPTNLRRNADSVERLFLQKLDANEGVLKNVMLSEEGGRFYHEQNKNVIIELDENEIRHLPKGYFWVDFADLNQLVQFNNYLNIQLRNLTSLLDI